MGLIRNIRKGFMFLRRDPGPGPADLEPIRQFLTPAQRDLFLGMDPGDQSHSLRVADFAAQSLRLHPAANESDVMAAALLHDVGKTGAGLGLVFRTFWVFGHRLVPWVMDWIAERSTAAAPGTLRYKMHIQHTHPQISARMMQQAGVRPEVCAWVASTGLPVKPTDPLELRLLMAADADRLLPPES
jgi:hypothetical protein